MVSRCCSQLKLPLLRLILAALLFLGWISWLGYLALTSTRPVVLSRPQFLGSQVDVIALLTETDNRPAEWAEDVAVVWPRAQKEKIGPRIRVRNLSDLSVKDGWDGPGRYILPLVKEGADFRVAAIARSPGYTRGYFPPRIYRQTSQTLKQLDEILAKKGTSGEE